MSKTVTLLAALTVATAGDQASVDVGGKTPFIPGRKARAVFHGTGVGTAPLYQIDGSSDDTVWVEDVCDTDMTDPSGAVECKVYRYMRVVIDTAAGTPGLLGVHLEGLG
jgi:hypothetical protein